MIDLAKALKLAQRLAVMPADFGQEFDSKEYARIIVTYGKDQASVDRLISKFVEGPGKRPPCGEFKAALVDMQEQSGKRAIGNPDCPLCSGTGYEIVLVRTERVATATGRMVDKTAEVLDSAACMERTNIPDPQRAVTVLGQALSIEYGKITEGEPGFRNGVHESARPCPCRCGGKRKEDTAMRGARRKEAEEAAELKTPSSAE